MKVQATDWLLLSPELFLTAAGMILLASSVFVGKAKEELFGFLSVLMLGITGVLLVFVSTMPERAHGPILGGMFVVDNFALFFKFLVLLAMVLTVLASVRFVGEAPYPGGEYYALVVFSGVGMFFMASGSNLISIYVALELMALASYVLAGYFKGEIKSTEAALKYFILGAFSSAVLLYGLSLVYGLGGKMGLADLARLYTGTQRTNAIALGILMILAGLLFKIAAVPFHLWTPDVYEGSPTPVTAFFSVGPKVAAYAIFARIFYVAFPKFQADWGLIVALVAAATMIWGNLAALLQTNVKRMFAYSSIAHAGYALLGVLGFQTKFGMWGVLVYLLAYTLMNFGAFALIIFLEAKGYAAESVSDFDGLAKRNMPAAVVMLLFLLSLAGIPPTAGFIGKYYLFTAAMDAGYAWLAIIAVLASAVSLFYYFRIAAAMFFTDGVSAKIPVSYALTAAVIICAVGTLVIGVAPESVLDVLHRCVPSKY
ncbi:MAG: NADH-quinone oxidoreductase subunit N [Acidobacteria bacterium]|nr:NADH-quinone oxidoreductase subunit N [Acidobacteriota bacterium]MCA1611139.1 NADH-quinone oxidoreductase subunit N [Acidobacteriota bacterium]